MRSEARAAAGALALACALPPMARSDVRERVVAVAEARPVFLSEVRIVQALKGLDARAAVESVIDERLMEREAARVPQSVVGSDEAEAAYRSLVETRPSLAALGDEVGLRRLARRQLVILKYVEFRFRPQVRIEDEELREAYEVEHGGDPQAPSFESAAPALRARLEETRLSALLEQWVRELRTEADVRYNAVGTSSAPPSPATVPR